MGRSVCRSRRGAAIAYVGSSQEEQLLVLQPCSYRVRASLGRRRQRCRSCRLNRIRQRVDKVRMQHIPNEMLEPTSAATLMSLRDMLELEMFCNVKLGLYHDEVRGRRRHYVITPDALDQSLETLITAPRRKSRHTARSNIPSSYKIFFQGTSKHAPASILDALFRRRDSRISEGSSVGLVLTYSIDTSKYTKVKPVRAALTRSLSRRSWLGRLRKR